MTAAMIEVSDDIFEFNDWAIEHRWSDGLPLLPPTAERVNRMLQGTDWPRETVVANVPVSYGPATVEAIAVNAVMAGCHDSALPILIAAVQAMCEEQVNLYTAQSTTHPCAVMVMVSGPLAAAAGVHCGSGLFGPGFRANATIGRTVRLIQQNVGGAWPGESDRSTHGSPAKFTFCYAENEQDSPWEPYRVAVGYPEETTTVTVSAAEGPHNLNDHVSTDPRGILFTFAHSIATIATNNAYIPGADYFVVVGPEHARVLADGGFGRRDVQEYLFERARIPYKEWKLGGMPGLYPAPRFLDAADDDFPVRITGCADDVHVVVAGGPGRHSAWMPTVGATRVATRVVAASDGSPIISGKQ